MLLFDVGCAMTVFLSAQKVNVPRLTFSAVACAEERRLVAENKLLQANLEEVGFPSICTGWCFVGDWKPPPPPPLTTGCLFDGQVRERYVRPLSPNSELAQTRERLETTARQLDVMEVPL